MKPLRLLKALLLVLSLNLIIISLLIGIVSGSAYLQGISLAQIGVIWLAGWPHVHWTVLCIGAITISGCTYMVYRELE